MFDAGQRYTYFIQSPPSRCALRRAAFALRAKAGGARRSRTADLLNAIQALSQLSYGPDRRRGVGKKAAPEFPEYRRDGCILHALRAGLPKNQVSSSSSM